MRKILIFILCAMLMIALPVVASAEEVDTNVSTTEEVTTEVENEPSVTESIVDYVTSHLEELSVIFALIASAFYDKIVRNKMNGSIGVLNNNAIAVAKNSEENIAKVLAEAKDMAKVVESYKEEIGALLGEIRKSAEEKKSLEETLDNVETFLKTAKLATLEMSNEVADLLLLANIPNSKKEELYARHTKAVHDLEAVEEVKSDGNKES
jgi:hypothetical protein